MPLPPKYRKSSDITASYDYTDIIEGTGHVTFYGSGAATSEGINIVYLIQKQFFGKATIGEGTHTLDLSPFNFPKTLKGTAYVSFYLDKTNVGVHTVTMKFQKVSDTTTDISSAIVTRDINTADSQHEVLPIPLTTTVFKRGDILRLHVVISEGDGAATIDCFPLGTKPFLLSIPFKIDL